MGAKRERVLARAPFVSPPVILPAAHDQEGGAARSQQGSGGGEPEPFPAPEALLQSWCGSICWIVVGGGGPFDLNLGCCFGHEQIFLSRHSDARRQDGQALHRKPHSRRICVRVGAISSIAEGWQTKTGI